MREGMDVIGEVIRGSAAGLPGRLCVDLLRRALHTDAEVRLQTALRTATARGMRSDFDGERAQLLNDVKMDYDPEG